jgi:hypothetical protein
VFWFLARSPYVSDRVRYPPNRVARFIFHGRLSPEATFSRPTRCTAEFIAYACRQGAGESGDNNDEAERAEEKGSLHEG